MNIKKTVPKRKELLRVLAITAVIFPIFILLRGKELNTVPMKRYLRELGILFFTLITTTKSLQIFHYNVAKPLLSTKKAGLKITSEILFIIILTPVSVTLWTMVFFPYNLFIDFDPRIPLFISFVNMSILFVYLYYYRFQDTQEKFREVVANQERLKFEKITAQYKSLQNHISPHFIFNCLGGLDRLIRDNPKEATRVIYSLSDCLQHILITLEKGTITLEEELIFIDKYEELLHIRFPGSIQISKFIDQAHYHKKIPPCILQMLIENAVKHNNFSSEHKLTIIISSLDGDRLSVSNNFAVKKEENGQLRMGTGLENIRQRFQLLTDDQIIIQQTSTLFTANLPLLNNN